MADPDTKKLKLKELHRTSSDDFVRFLKNKLPDSDPCPACGEDDWSVVCPRDDEDMYRLGLVVRNAPKPFYLSTFAYYCDNCGYLRQHVSKLVYDWVKENPMEDLSDTVDESGKDDSEPTLDE